MQSAKRRAMGGLQMGLFLAIGLALWGGVQSAEARPRILRPGTRPAEFNGGIGTHVFLRSGATFVLHHTLGYHFSGDSSGPALGGDFDLLLSGRTGFSIGPRFWWDIPIARMSIYIAPYVRTAFTLFFPLCDFCDAEPGLNFQIGARAKIILNNRGVLFIELPALALDVFFNRAGTFVQGSFRFMLGGGVTF